MCIITIKSLEFCKQIVETGIIKLVAYKIKIINDWLILKTIYKVH